MYIDQTGNHSNPNGNPTHPVSVAKTPTGWFYGKISFADVEPYLAYIDITWCHVMALFIVQLFTIFVYASARALFRGWGINRASIHHPLLPGCHNAYQARSRKQPSLTRCMTERGLPIE